VEGTLNKLRPSLFSPTCSFNPFESDSLGKAEEHSDERPTRVHAAKKRGNYTTQLRLLLLPHATGVADAWLG